MKKGTYKVVILNTTLPRQKRKNKEVLQRVLENNGVFSQKNKIDNGVVIKKIVFVSCSMEVVKI